MMLSTAILLLKFACAAYAQYDPYLSLDALYFAKSTVCGAASIQSWNCPPCAFHPQVRSVTVFDTSTVDTQAYAAYDPTTNTVVVAFRGSENIANWIEDFEFGKIPYPACNGCEVHEGFYNVFLTIEAPIVTTVGSLLQQYNGARLLVTGHSLGAALAVLLTLSLIQSGYSNAVLYNFGLPRVGNPAFAAYFAQTIQGGLQYRVTHRADPVPHLPPQLFGFLHPPHEVWYDNEGNTSWTDCQDSATAEDPNCSDSVIFWDPADHTQYLGIDTGCSGPAIPAAGSDNHPEEKRRRPLRLRNGLRLHGPDLPARAG